MKTLKPLQFLGGVYNVADGEKFRLGIKIVMESLEDKGASLFVADNLMTWCKNLSFLRDASFLELLKDDNSTDAEKGIVWRLYILIYFAEIASRAEGDFVELGCHTGYSASKVVKKIDFPGLDKNYYLYDLFEWNEGDEHTHMPEIGRASCR